MNTTLEVAQVFLALWIVITVVLYFAILLADDHDTTFWQFLYAPPLLGLILTAIIGAFTLVVLAVTWALRVLFAT